MLSVILVGLLFTSCGTTAKFVYPSGEDPATRSVRASDATIAVLPFKDERSADNSNGFFLYAIPLMPFGTMNYKRPDAARRYISILEYDCTPNEDLAKAAAAELERQGLCKRAFFSFGGGDADVADFVLHGAIRDMEYNGRVMSYGLSVFGPLLWFIGLPAGISDNSLLVDISLVAKGSEEPAWTATIEEEGRVVQGLYYNMGQDCLPFTKMYERGLREAFVGMASVIGAEPAPLPEELLKDLKARKKRRKPPEE